jgi:hypothetical protein
LGRVNVNNNGRDSKGKIRSTPFPGLDGLLMTSAEALARILKRQHPQAEVTELFRGDRDEPVAETLADLGEIPPVDVLANAVKDCLSFGLTQQDILAVVEVAQK